jgi:hypothetical protein
LTEWDAALFEEVEDELKVLKFFDGDSVQMLDAGVKVAVFLKVKGAGCGFAFEVGVIDENGGKVAEDSGEPIGGDFFAEQEHGESWRRPKEAARGKLSATRKDEA